MVKTVLNAIRITATLGDEGPLSVTEICRRLDLPKSSAHNILETLTQEGMVSKNSETHKYALGVRLIEFGNRAQAHLDITQIAHPYLVDLNDRTDETVHLTVLDNDEVLYVDCVESRMRFRTYSVIGVRAPLHCTAVGKAILAFLPRERQLQIMARRGLIAATKNTITDENNLLLELEKTARRGYAIDNMEHEELVRCVAGPIFNWDQEVFASVSLSGPSQRNTLKKLAELGKSVMEATREISLRLGYHSA